MNQDNISDPDILLAYQYLANNTRTPTYRNKKLDPISLQLLLEAGGVIFGSRGIHIENQYSDYDLAFSYEQHKELYRILVNARVSVCKPTSYFQSSPEAGYHTFFQHEVIDSVTSRRSKVDIIFVHNDEDLDVIRSSIQDLQSIPQYMLRDKKFRIDAYNKALQHRGWKVNPDLRNPRPPVVRRDIYSRGESLTRGITPWS